MIWTRKRPTASFSRNMEDVIKIVRTYRLTDSLAERLRLADQIICLVRPNLSLFLFGRLPSSATDDVMQLVLSAIADGLDGFKGNTQELFRRWCFRIARFKVADYYKKQERDPLLALPPEEFLIAADAAGAGIATTLGVHDDLNTVMSMLKQSKPDCFDYLWDHYILDVPIEELAEANDATYDAFRMRITRCLETAQNLVA